MYNLVNLGGGTYLQSLIIFAVFYLIGNEPANLVLLMICFHIRRLVFSKDNKNCKSQGGGDGKSESQGDLGDF